MCKDDLRKQIRHKHLHNRYSKKPTFELKQRSKVRIQVQGCIPLWKDILKGHLKKKKRYEYEWIKYECAVWSLVSVLLLQSDTSCCCAAARCARFKLLLCRRDNPSAVLHRQTCYFSSSPSSQQDGEQSQRKWTKEDKEAGVSWACLYAAKTPLCVCSYNTAFHRSS